MLLFADEGSVPLVLLTTLANGLGEEVFFRGALYATLAARPGGGRLDRGLRARDHGHPEPRRWCWPPAVMGTLFGLQRRASGGLQAPLLTHLTWSTLMLRYLPPLFRTSRQETT